MEDHSTLADAFAQSPANEVDAASLSPLDSASVQRLIAALHSDGKRAHLEVLGRSTLARPLRKAAKKAAYALRSAGVGEGAAPRGGLDLANHVDLSAAALVGPPGLSGRFWVMLSELPDTVPLAVELPPWGQGDVHTTVLDALTPAIMRRYQREATDDDQDRLESASASLAIRMIERVAEEVRAGSGNFGADWDRVLWWCAKARELGADPTRVDARNALRDVADAPSLDLQRTTEALLEVRQAGLHHPPEPAVQALLTQVAQAAEAKLSLTRGQFDDRLDGLADAACDVFFATEAAQARAARGLEATADVLLHEGLRDEAIQSLWLSDQLATGALLPHELGLVAGAFRRIISYDAAWTFHQKKMAGDTPADEAPVEAAP